MPKSPTPASRTTSIATATPTIPGFALLRAFAACLFIATLFFFFPATSYADDQLGDAVPPKVSQWKAPIEYWSRVYHWNPNFVAAIIMAESGGHPAAVSPSGAVGLMQLLRGPMDPFENIHRGVAYLDTIYSDLGPNLDVVIAAYNAGPGTVRYYHGVPPYPSVRRYIQRVRGLYAQYRYSRRASYRRVWSQRKTGTSTELRSQKPLPSKTIQHRYRPGRPDAR